MRNLDELGPSHLVILTLTIGVPVEGTLPIGRYCTELEGSLSASVPHKHT